MASVEEVSPGKIVSGVVERTTTYAVLVKVSERYSGSIATEHLVDHCDRGILLNTLLKPGYIFKKLLILDVVKNVLIMSAKHSLVNATKLLDITQAVPGTILQGYVSNMIDTGCFIRFNGPLIGFAPSEKILDDGGSSLEYALCIGQSVRAKIVNTDNAHKIMVTLRQRSCSSVDVSYIEEFFRLENEIGRLQLKDFDASEFSIGSVLEGNVDKTYNGGISIKFPKYKGVCGVISPYHLGGSTPQVGSTVQVAVLDLSIPDSHVDLSLKSEFVSKQELSRNQPPNKKSKREASKELKINDTVNALVEIVKSHYLILSIPDYKFALGFASITDYNTQKLQGKEFVNGQSVTATVAVLPTTDGRLLLLLK